MTWQSRAVFSQHVERINSDESTKFTVDLCKRDVTGAIGRIGHCGGEDSKAASAWILEWHELAKLGGSQATTSYVKGMFVALRSARMTVHPRARETLKKPKLASSTN